MEARYTMATNMNKNTAEYILGMTGTYDAAALRKAYRKLAKENHPDMAEARGMDRGVAEARMSDINAAYDYISDMFTNMGYETLTATPAAPGTEAASATAEPAAAAEPEPAVDWNGFWENWDAAYDARVAEENAAREASKAAAAAEAEPVVEPAATASKATAPIWYRIVRGVLGFDWVWRVAFFLVALALYSMIGGHGAGIDMEVASQYPMEIWPVILGLYAVAGINLLFGFLTKPMTKAIRWALDNTVGKGFATEMYDYEV